MFFVKYKSRRFPPKFKRQADIQQILFNLSEAYMHHWIDRQVEKQYSITYGRTDRTNDSYFGPNNEINETPTISIFPNTSDSDTSIDESEDADFGDI